MVRTTRLAPRVRSCILSAQEKRKVVSAQMENLFTSSEPVDFWVWVNPDNFLVRHQITVTGGFTSGGLIEPTRSNLMFIPNPDFRGELTPFQHGVMRDYVAEYNLELARLASFNAYPSRLNAIYLFLAEQEAHKYSARHKSHVGDRILKRCRAVTPCTYSVHDCSWVDFMRLQHSVDARSLDEIGKAYWSGRHVEDYKLEFLGEPWTQTSILEALFLGRVEFYDQAFER